MLGRLQPLKALLLNDASLAGHHGSALVTQQARALAADAGIDVATGWSWEAALKATYRPGSGFDLILVNGEGSLHSNSRAAERIAAIAKDLARSGRLPAYLINATVEGNSATLTRDLGQFRLRYVRDHRSRSVLAKECVDAVTVHDLTLTAAHLPRAHDPSPRAPLLITDASDQETSDRLFAVTSALSGARPVTLRARPPWPTRGDRMRRIAFEIKRRAARLMQLSPWSLRYGHSIGSLGLAGQLARSRGVVCGRYHAVCIALRMGVPFVAIDGNTGKTRALLADIGLEHRLVPLAELEGAPADYQVPPYSDTERLQIGEFLASVEDGAADMFRRIADDARRWHHSTTADVAA
jgi:hypothetical protein